MEVPGLIKETKPDNRYRYFKTAALFFSWICQGLYNEIIGPTLLDLMARVGCNHEEISRVLSARSAGLFIGSLVGGVIHDKWARHRDVIIAASLLLSAVTVTVSPWCTTLWMLGVFFHLMGHGHALLSTGGNPTIAVLWRDRSAGPYQLLHAGFGVGAILGILICQPFISGDSPTSSVLNINESLPQIGDNYSTNATFLDNNDNFVLNTKESQSVLGNDYAITTTVFYGNHDLVRATNEFQSQIGNNYTIKATTSDDDNLVISGIEYPYVMVGVCCTLASALFLAYYFIRSPPQFVPEHSEWRDVFNPKRCSGGQTIFGIQMLGLIFIFFMFIVGLERGFGKFIFSYAVKSMGLSTCAATWLGLFFWISYTIGRLSSFVLARCIPPHILLFTQISGTISAAILLNIFPNSGNAVLCLTIAFGFFMSQVYPTCLGWANGYIEISSMTIAVIDTGSSTGGMLIQWLTGYLFQYFGPHTFLYVIMALSVSVLVTFLVLHLVASRHGKRFSEKMLPNIVPCESGVFLSPDQSINGLNDQLKEEEKSKMVDNRVLQSA